MYIEDYIQKLKDVITSSREIGYEKVNIEVRSIFAGKIKGELVFKDNSKLCFTEIVDVEKEIKKFRYTYKYIKDEKEIFRYDNAPHHRELTNFPHHKHIGTGIVACPEPNLKRILSEINLFILKSKL